MFNTINSIILVSSLAGIIFIFFRRFPFSVKKNKEENNNQVSLEERKIFNRTLEEWDKAIEKITEIVLRKSRVIFLKGDNLVSNWLNSLKKKNSFSERNNFFEEIIEENNKEEKKKNDK